LHTSKRTHDVHSLDYISKGLQRQRSADSLRRLRSLLTTVAWIVVVQGSSRLQGVMQKPTVRARASYPALREPLTRRACIRQVVLSPDWYAKLTKPAWQPPPWAFPAAWIPLKLAQTIGAAVLWTSIGHRVFDAPAVWLYVAHITLGDVWNAQFFLKQRILTGLLIISAFWLLAVGAHGSLGARSPTAPSALFSLTAMHCACRRSARPSLSGARVLSRALCSRRPSRGWPWRPASISTRGS
jgi:benzodiazapine receptor